MSQELFGRVAEFQFGYPGALGRSYTDLRVKFKIEKTSKAQPNKAQIQVYNLTRDSRALAEKKGIVLVLKAGYGTTAEVIFSGNVAKVWTEMQAPDYVTTFEIGDGEKNFQTARLDISFNGGVDLKDIFRKLVTTLGSPSANLDAVPSKKTLSGLSLSGLSRVHMDQLSEQNGLEWSIQDNLVQVLQKDGTTLEESILLNSNTGLIEIPRKKDDGIELKSLLQPRIRPGRSITVESTLITGNYRVLKVTHAGDTHGKEWHTVIETIGVKLKKK